MLPLNCMKYNILRSNVSCTNKRCLNVVVRSPTPFGLGRNGCWPSRGSQLPRALPFIFSLCCPLNDRRRTAHSIYKIGRLFSLFIFSCPTLALLRLLILLLLLMSSNVHLNPGPHLSLLCVRWKCDLAGQVSAMLHLLQMGPSKYSQLSLRIQSSCSSHSWSCLPCRNTVTPSSDSSDTSTSSTSTVQSAPLY